MLRWSPPVLAVVVAALCSCKGDEASEGVLDASSAAPSAAVSAEAATATVAISDERLAAAISEAISRDAILRSQAIRVSVVNGDVTLVGTVRRLADAWRAAQIAEEFKGPVSIDNTLGVEPLARSDAAIAKSVTDALASDPATRTAKVRVTVDFGAVVLSGTADSIAQRGLLADVVSRVRGVEGVTMTGVTLSHASSRADAELEADVGDELRDDARLDGTSVQAAVHGKDAVLSGVVGSLAQRDAASADAWSAGVASVDAHAVRIDWTAVGRATSADRRPPPSDPQIAAAVRRRLERDVRVGDQLPSVDVAQGAVTLAGNVADFRADGAAIGDARSVSGVWRVEDAMRVAPARRESDALIQEQVLSGIYEDVAAPDSRSVRVLTSNGKVTLRGAVASQEDKKVIEDDVEEVPGVAALDDQLVVRGNSPQTTVVAPGSLAHLVTEDIFWDPRIAQDDTITVAAAPNGDVTLAGHVESTREARAANDDAIRAGAAHVIDHIEVVNVPP